MRVGMFHAQASERLAVDGEAVLAPEPRSAMGALLPGRTAAQGLDGSPRTTAGPPVEPRAAARPRRIVPVGLNYPDHGRKAGVELLDHPLVFARFPSVVTAVGGAS